MNKINMTYRNKFTWKRIYTSMLRILMKLESCSKLKNILKNTSMKTKMSKYYQTVEDLDVNLEELIACYEHFKESKGFSTDNPDNIDFNAICVNRIPGDPNSLVGPKVRGLYWTYPDDSGKEEQRLENGEGGLARRNVGR